MDLLNAIEGLPAYRSLRDRLSAGLDTINTVQGLGLPRAARLPLVARLHQDLQKPVLLISNRADRALALFEELQFWSESENTHYFPEPNPLFYEQAGWGQGTMRDRLRVLTLLAKYLIPGQPRPERPPIIVAPIRAIDDPHPTQTRLHQIFPHL